MGRGTNHLVAGIVAGLAVPIGVLALDLPLLLTLPVAGLLYAGVALALAPRERRLRIDTSRIDRGQADVARDLIDEAQTSVDRLHGVARQLRAPAERARIEALADSARTILDRLAGAPEKIPAVRRFLAYYLPRSAEIAEGLVILSRQATPDATRRRGIEATLGRLAEAFAFYADNLDRADLQNLDVELKLIDRALAEDVGALSSTGGA